MDAASTTIALWGPDHHEYGRIVTEDLGADLAIGLSRGRHPKRYSYTDPNEDVVAAVSQADRRLLVLADGHNGHEAATIAVHEVLDWATADELPPAVTATELVDLVHRVSERIFNTTTSPEAAHPESRTTLVLAHIGAGRLSFAAMGDSALYLATASAVERLDTSCSNRFVGYPMTHDDVAAALSVGARTLKRGDQVVLATDGFTDFAGHIDHVLLEAYAAASASQAVVQCVERAFDGGAGDNVGIAIARTVV